jgi:KH domain
MSSTPTPDDHFTALLVRLADRLDSLETRLDRIEVSANLTIARTDLSAAENAKSPPFYSQKATKGKGKAKAPVAPSKAKPAKKERPTKKAANLPNPVPLPLAQTFPMEGKTDRHLVTVVIPDASAQHAIGQGGKGLKQIHDISGARVNAYSMAGSNDERHVSIRGTDLQIGDALVVLGKRIARKKVRTPKTKKPGPSTDSSKPAPFISTQQSSTLPHHSSTQRSGPSTGPRIVEVSTERKYESSVTPAAPTVVMASPSPASTPIVPSVAMGSPSPYTPNESLTPMQVDVLLSRESLTGQRLPQWRGPDPPPHESASAGRGGNTARRSRPGFPRGRGRG